MRGPAKKARRKSGAGSAPVVTCELPPDLSALSRGEIITKYHEIQKKIAMVDKSPQFPNEASRQAFRQVLRAQLALIGIEQYQNASREGEALGGGFDSSLWVMKALPTYRDRLCSVSSTISILDVGAIAHRFPNELKLPAPQASPSDGPGEVKLPLDVTSIDLNPEDSAAGRGVIKADFFDFAQQRLREHADVKYDVICLSLCVNFEGCAKRRGLMIHLASQILRTGGLLFLVLPRACVKNSRYLDEERFHNILCATNLDVLSTTYTAKLMLSVSGRRDAGEEVDRKAWRPLAKKEILRQGAHRNNFAIYLCAELLREGRPAEGPKLRTTVGTENTFVGKTKGKNPQKRKGKKDKKVAASSTGIAKQHLTSNQRKRARRQAMQMQKRASVNKKPDVES